MKTVQPAHRLIALFAAGMLLSSVGLAQQPVRDASVDEMVRQLAPTPASTLTRGLQRNITPERRQIDLVIPFDFDSAALQPASKPLLERLADAMKTERLAALRFRVEGHTDAKGSAAYNQDLSTRRPLHPAHALPHPHAICNALPVGKQQRERDAGALGERISLPYCDPLRQHLWQREPLEERQRERYGQRRPLPHGWCNRHPQRERQRLANKRRR